MGNSYVDGKVREALRAAKGSRGGAQQLLMSWAVEDPQLLLGIAQPFLKAIAAAAIERGARGLGGGPAQGGRAPAPGGMRSGAARPNSALSREALESVLSRMGQDPAPAPAPAPSRPGVMRSATTMVNAPGGNASGGDVSHEKAMMAIAKAFAAKKVR